MNRSASCLTSSSTSLLALPARQKARVAGFSLPPEQRARLMEMGLTHGAELQLIRFAPLGDPLEIEIRGYRLSLRKREAEGIQVVTI